MNIPAVNGVKVGIAFNLAERGADNAKNDGWDGNGYYKYKHNSIISECKKNMSKTSHPQLFAL